MNTRIGGFESPLRWVKLSTYSAMAGDSYDAIEKRLRTGVWVRDVHVRKPEGSRDLWVNLDAVNDWAAGLGPAHLHGTGKAVSRR